MGKSIHCLGGVFYTTLQVFWFGDAALVRMVSQMAAVLQEET